MAMLFLVSQKVSFVYSNKADKNINLRKASKRHKSQKKETHDFIYHKPKFRIWIIGLGTMTQINGHHAGFFFSCHFSSFKFCVISWALNNSSDRINLFWESCSQFGFAKISWWLSIVKRFIKSDQSFFGRLILFNDLVNKYSVKQITNSEIDTIVNNWVILCDKQHLRFDFVCVCSTINSITMYSTFLLFDSSFLFLLKYSLDIFPSQLKYVLFILIILQIYTYDVPFWSYDFWCRAKIGFSLTFISFTI